MPVSSFFWFSYFALWILVVLLGGAVFLLYQHMGTQMQHRDRAMERFGPKIDERVDITLTTIDGTLYQLGSPTTTRSHVLLFAASGCSECESLKPLLERLVSKFELVATVVVYFGDSRDTHMYAEKIQPAALVADPRAEFGRLWNIGATPFAVVMDYQGIVRKKGVMSTEQMAKYFFETAQRLNAAKATGINA